MIAGTRQLMEVAAEIFSVICMFHSRTVSGVDFVLYFHSAVVLIDGITNWKLRGCLLMYI